MPILSIALALCAPVSVHDGDTIRCGTERVRLLAIDAPEMRGSPKCIDPKRNGWCDFALAVKSRDALRLLLSRGPVQIERRGIDRYGRTLAAVMVNGVDAGAHLVQLGLAKPWR